MFHVTLWESHPDEDNDDCGAGDDFESEEAAAAVYLAPQDHFRRMREGGYTHVMFEGPSGRLIRELPDAAETRRRRAREARESDEEMRRELAMEAGMLGGCDAYNDMMGWSTEPPEED
jgi:hypothetical protein